MAIFGLSGARERRSHTTSPATRGTGRIDHIAAHLSEAVLPISVLHQTVIVAAGVYVVQDKRAAQRLPFEVALSNGQANRSYSTPPSSRLISDCAAPSTRAQRIWPDAR